MNNILNNHFLKNRTFVHRGIQNRKKGIVENTLESCIIAKEYGYGIEIDVRITKYNTVILLHDRNIKRLTGIDKNYYDITEKDLNNIIYKNSNCKIAKLEEILKNINGEVPLLIELKTDFHYIRTRKLVKEVNRLMNNYNGEYAIQSVFPSSYKMYRRINENVLLGLVTPVFLRKCKFINNIIVFLLLKIYKYDFISYNINLMPNKYIKDLNIIKLFWNVNNRRKMNLALLNNGNLIWSMHDKNGFMAPRIIRK